MTFSLRRLAAAVSLAGLAAGFVRISLSNYNNFWPSYMAIALAGSAIGVLFPESAWEGAMFGAMIALLAALILGGRLGG